MVCGAESAWLAIHMRHLSKKEAAGVWSQLRAGAEAVQGLGVDEGRRDALLLRHRIPPPGLEVPTETPSSLASCYLLSS